MVKIAGDMAVDGRMEEEGECQAALDMLCETIHPVVLNTIDTHVYNAQFVVVRPGDWLSNAEDLVYSELMKHLIVVCVVEISEI